MSAELLEKNGFEFDPSENKYIRWESSEDVIGIERTNNGFEVSIIGCSDGEFFKLKAFEELQDAIEFAERYWER